ncbi:hypothetical protein COOONC_24129 [Cooperia oncophora]
MIDEWMDLRAGDPWPDRILVKALDKTLDTIPGENPDQYVALWYQAGEPVMGRIWNEGGKVAANFCWNKNEYKGNVGSIQVLVHLSEHVRGFDYQWLPYPQAASFDKDKEWIPVHVNNTKGDISSGVITFERKTDSWKGRREKREVISRIRWQRKHACRTGMRQQHYSVVS